MTRPSVAALRHALQELTGLRLDSALARDRVATVSAQLGLSDTAGLAHARAALATPGQVHRIADVVTIPETYFFRDRARFRFLRDRVLPELSAQTPDRPLNLWSAGCSTGEEAYTLAFLLDQVRLGAGDAIWGTDLSARAIRAAACGVYGEWSFRGVPTEDRVGRFQPHEGKWRVDDRFRERVVFRTHNLVTDPPPVPQADLILLRNVLIYLAPWAVRAVAERMAAALAPGGWLVTAPSDPLLDATGLQVVRTEVGLLYRRPLAPAARKRPAVSSDASLARPRVRTGSAPTRRHRPQPPARPVVPSSAPPPERSAVDRCRAAIDLLHHGRPHEALAEAKAARYLDPQLVMAHVAVARSQRQLGDAVAFDAARRAALNLLGRLQPDTEVPLAGEPAVVLMGLLRALSAGVTSGKADAA